MKIQRPVILASTSPRRSQLLKEWKVLFAIVPSHADESTRQTMPSRIVKELALRKAQSVARSLKEGLVIGADTIVVLKGEIIGKPKDKRDAARILGALNGTCHKVYTGIAVIDAATGHTEVAYDVSRVKMRRLGAADVRRLSAKHLDKAGAYAVQEKSDAFVEKIEGDYFNVVGLPFDVLKKTLKKFGMSISGGRPLRKFC